MLEMKEISLFFVIFFVKTSVSEQLCFPGERFAWDCNACICLDGKNTHCTLTTCPNDNNILYYPGLNLIVKKTCVPGQTKFEYCNSCVCDDDGESYSCTNHVCAKDLWNNNGTLNLKEASLKPIDVQTKRVCKPNSVFKQKCNACRCSSDGSSATCTYMNCNKFIYQEVFTVVSVSIPDHQRFIRSATDTICTPKSQFKESCNTCVCSNDGLSKICTQLKCNENLSNHRSNVKSVPEQREKGDVKEPKSICKPNLQFKVDCNICICSKDGLQRACTMIICNKNKNRK